MSPVISRTQYYSLPHFLRWLSAFPSLYDKKSFNRCTTVLYIPIHQHLYLYTTYSAFLHFSFLSALSTSPTLTSPSSFCNLFPSTLTSSILSPLLLRIIIKNKNHMQLYTCTAFGEQSFKRHKLSFQEWQFPHKVQVWICSLPIN